MLKKRNLILYCQTFLDQLCSKRSPYLVCGITYVVVHMQRKRKQSFEQIAFFLCVNVGQKTVYAAAKSIASSDIEELLGWPCLLFLLMFTLCEFGPVWNLELPNLEVKPAVFLRYFPAYEMTSNFDPNFRQTPLSYTGKSTSSYSLFQIKHFER